MIIRRILPPANDHTEDLVPCKWSTGGSGLLQMIIRRIRLLVNDHPKDLASCKWSPGYLGSCNDHPEGLASYKCHLCQDPDSILRTFLEQLVLDVYVFMNFKFYGGFTHQFAALVQKITKKKFFWGHPSWQPWRSFAMFPGWLFFTAFNFLPNARVRCNSNILSSL